MSTMLLECCTAATKFVKCGCTNEAVTNCKDVEIAQDICCAIIWVTAIIAGGLILWKLIDHIAKCIQDKRDSEKNSNEKKLKQKSDLIDKLLDFLKNNVSKKNDNQGQQAKSQTLSMKPDDIYNLLQGNAAKSCSEELRQRYIELCVEVLKKLESGDGQSDGGVSGKTIDVKISGKGHQSDKTGNGASNGEPESKKPSDIYIDLLCFLIAHVEKGTLDEKDLNVLRKSCGLNPQTI